MSNATSSSSASSGVGDFSFSGIGVRRLYTSDASYSSEASGVGVRRLYTSDASYTPEIFGFIFFWYF